MEELGQKLGPINWQFMATKKFDAADFEGLPEIAAKGAEGPAVAPRAGGPQPDLRLPGIPVTWAAKYGAAIVYAVDDEEPTWPCIDQPTADFTYARLMSSKADEPTGMRTRKSWTGWSSRPENGPNAAMCSPTSIAGAKVRNPGGEGGGADRELG
ncbi:DUF72 domain-containing protein [Caulobacter segnis]